MKNAEIVIVDFGSLTTSLIERTARESGCRSIVMTPEKAGDYILAKRPKAVILSGSKHSVNSPNSPKINPAIFEVHIPILGICYGAQLIAKSLGGQVNGELAKKEYGPTQIKHCSSELFSRTPEIFEVWASHGDTISVAPPGFYITASSVYGGGIAAIQNREKCIWGVQFHPEVTHTEYGPQILSNFIKRIAECEQDWFPTDLVGKIQSSIKAQIGNETAMVAVSGGVDSMTLAVMASRVLGKKLHAVCLNGGQLRKGEKEEIQENCKQAQIPLKIIVCAEEFGKAWNAYVGYPINLWNRPDADRKRRFFSETYRYILSTFAKNCGAKFFLQGTLKTDMIESGETGAACIKKHHNVGKGLGRSIISLHQPS